MKNKWALSEVVSTLIILVISVLLAGVVTYYAINVVSTRVQEESLSLENPHIWLNPEATPGSPDYSMAALMVINTGGRDVVINNVAVRGQDCAWTTANVTGANPNADSQFIVYSITDQPVATDLYFQPLMTGQNDTSAAYGNVLLNPSDTSGSTFYFNYAQTDLVLRSGYTMLIYIINPDSITINDVGLTVSITLYTAQAMYYQECNVQAYAPVTS